ncbi:MAG: hypothetical protein ACYTEX_01005 [Planctomycetota bacterium]
MKDMYERSTPLQSLPLRSQGQGCGYRHSTISCLPSSVLRCPSSVLRQTAQPALLTNSHAQKKTVFTKRTQTFLVLKVRKSFFCKGLRRQGCIFAIKKTNPNEPKLPKSKTFFTKRTQIFLIEQRSQILLLQRFTNPSLHFRYQENEPKLPEKKTFLTKRTQIFLVDEDHKSFWCKGLRSQACIFAIKKTNPNEPKLRESKNFFYETNPNLLGTQGSQILFIQRLTKARLHFRYQENEPKRTQTRGAPSELCLSGKMFGSLVFWSFVLVSCLVLRISCFWQK